MTIGELQGNFSSFPWLEYIRTMLNPVETATEDDLVLLGVPKFVKSLETLLMETPKRYELYSLT